MGQSNSKKEKLQEQSGSNSMFTQQQQPQQLQQSYSNQNYQQVTEKYDDDEEIKLQEFVKSEEQASKYDIEKNISFNVTSMTKGVKLSSNQSQLIPAQISIKTADGESQGLTNRPSIDLICVIDKSGSMEGQKIQLVVDTLLCLLELLKENDRLSLVTFNSSGKRILPLVSVSSKNIDMIKNVIKQISVSGGTDINSGMKIAFEILHQRRIKNPVSSIFLLSDGQDSSGYNNVTNTLNYMKSFQDTFTINSFGFGNDHDPDLMNKISQYKDGGFYYVQKLDTVDEMFVDALGGLFSVVAQNVQIQVQVNKKNKLFADTNISETYGDLWKYDEKKNIYKINILQLISGVNKDFLCELEIPPITANLNDNERNTILLEADVTYEGLTSEKTTVHKQAYLELTFYNENDQMPENINEDVQMNVLRVRGAKALQQARVEADKGNWSQGQQYLQSMRAQIDKSNPQTKEKLKELFNDLNEGEINCKQDNYENFGKNKMISQNRAHMEQRSKGDGGYSNQMQKCMVNERKSKK